MDNVVKFNEEEHYCLIQLDAGKANAVSTQLAQELNVALDLAEEADLHTQAIALAQRLATLDMAANRGTKMRIRADMIKQMEVVIDSEFSTTG